jgi:hypothetical protein
MEHWPFSFWAGLFVRNLAKAIAPSPPPEKSGRGDQKIAKIKQNGLRVPAYFR